MDKEIRSCSEYKSEAQELLKEIERRDQPFNLKTGLNDYSTD